VNEGDTLRPPLSDNDSLPFLWELILIKHKHSIYDATWAVERLGNTGRTFSYICHFLVIIPVSTPKKIPTEAGILLLRVRLHIKLKRI
jgi:hypothetical protein